MIDEASDGSPQRKAGGLFRFRCRPPFNARRAKSALSAAQKADRRILIRRSRLDAAKGEPLSRAVIRKRLGHPPISVAVAVGLTERGRMAPPGNILEHMTF